MIDSLVRWFLNDPLQNFLLIFGSGGVLAAIVKWGPLWLDRRRILVRVLSEYFDTKQNPMIEVFLRFEVTNVGDKVTSLRPEVVVRAITPKAKSRAFVLPVQEADRQLPPHSQRQFTAVAIVEAVYPFCWFKRYSIRVLRGGGAIVRYRNAKNEDMSLPRYWYEYLLFRWFGRIIKSV